MSDYCTIAVLGLDSTGTKELKQVVDKSYFDLRIEHIVVFKSKSPIPFRIELQEEYDIIVVNPTAFTSSSEEIVSTIKGQYPLSEIVFVRQMDDYREILCDFRAGIRDVVHYPFDENEFLSALERSQAYRTLVQKSDSLAEILELFGQFADFRKFPSLFELMSKADRFVAQKFNATPMLVIHPFYQEGNQDSKSNESISFRTLWNKTLLSGEYKKDEVIHLLKKYHERGELEDQLPFWEHEREGIHYFAINLSIAKEAPTLAIFKILKRERRNSMLANLGHLSRVMQNSYQHLSLTKARDDLSQLVHHDDVTGLYNQRRLNLDLEMMIKEYRFEGQIFSVIFIDIDHFKSVNDGHGHLVGSQLLQDVSKVIKHALREADMVYRYGGDEFVVILPQTSGTEAKMVGERVLSEIKNHSFRAQGNKTFQLSVSIGVAQFPTDAASKKDILQIADDMMYKAKETGRGKVVTTQEMFAKNKG